MNKWFRSSPVYGFKANNVNKEAGVIEGVAVITMGEAKGHGVHIDSEFLDAVVEQGNALKQGLKVRFGHPSMSSTALGTFLGREKNFRRVGDVVRADLFLSNTAKETPGGDLYNYVLEMAENESDMFGTSIVFTPGESKFLSGDTKEYATLTKLHANDIVDDPAANPDGLFSAFNQESFAAQATEFFDLHPEMFELVMNNPDVIDGFLERYENYKNRKKEVIMDQEKDLTVQETTEEVAELEAAETVEEVELEQEEETTELEAVAEPTVEEERVVSVSEFQRIEEAFGTGIAVEALKNGLSFEDAKDKHYEAISEALSEALDTIKAQQEEINELKAAKAEVKTAPAKYSEPAQPKKSIINIK